MHIVMLSKLVTAKQVDGASRWQFLLKIASSFHELGSIARAKPCSTSLLFDARRFHSELCNFVQWIIA